MVWESSSAMSLLTRNIGFIGRKVECHCRNMTNNTLTKDSESYQVQHDETGRRFFINLEEGNIAILDYELVSTKVLDLLHTEVPPQFQGKGIAKILAKAALDYVVQKDFQMKLTCWYLQDYVSKVHLPEYTKRVVNGT